MSPMGITMPAKVKAGGVTSRLDTPSKIARRANHSRYQRTFADVPAHGRRLEILLTARRFRCRNAACDRRIFPERFPRDLTQPHARRTSRLDGILHAIAGITFTRCCGSGRAAKALHRPGSSTARQSSRQKLRACGSDGEFNTADVRQEDNVRHLVDETIAWFSRLDIAVNNAGTEGTGGPITAQTAESFAAAFETNILGVVLSMRLGTAAVPIIRRS